MSGLIFPAPSTVAGFVGRMLTKYRRPTMNTHTQRALSGKESRIALRAYPLMEWELSFDWLPDNMAPNGQGRFNYLPFSQDFTQWNGAEGGTGFAPLVVGSWFGSTAPDGTYTADRVILNSGGSVTSGNYCQVYEGNATVPAGTYCGSVWLKTNDGTTRTVLLFLSAVNVTVLVTVTSQWQRFSITGSLAVAGGINFYLQLGNGFATSSYADLSAWGAQLEQGASPTRYIPTNGVALRQSDFSSMLGFFTQMMGQWDTFLYQDPDFNTVPFTQFATGNGIATAFNLTAPFQPQQADMQGYNTPGGLGGLPEWVQNTNGLPGIFTGRYGMPELLSTGLRTNLLLQSNFAASWSPTNATITTNAATAPDGSGAASSFNEGTATGGHYAAQTAAITGGEYVTGSVWLKYSSLQYVTMLLYNGGAYTQATFDLVNGVISGAITSNGGAQGVAATITAFPNGWYRCSLAGALPAADTTCSVYIEASNVAAPSGTPTYTGTSRVFYLWGAQLEAGVQPTALIPTTTVQATNGGSDYSLTNLTSAGTAVQTFQQVQFASAPANNVPLLWTGSFFYRVRFSEDALEPEEILYGHWKLDSVKLEQVLL